MDRNSPPNYVEDSAASALKDVNAFVDYVHDSQASQGACLGPEPLVTPSIIPRYTCACVRTICNEVDVTCTSTGCMNSRPSMFRSPRQHFLCPHHHLI